MAGYGYGYDPSISDVGIDDADGQPTQQQSSTPTEGLEALLAMGFAALHEIEPYRYRLNFELSHMHGIIVTIISSCLFYLLRCIWKQ